MDGFFALFGPVEGASTKVGGFLFCMNPCQHSGWGGGEYGNDEDEKNMNESVG